MATADYRLTGRRTSIKLVLSGFTIVWFPVPVNAECPGPGCPATKDIVDLAVESGNFTTLAAALDASGFSDTLKGDGPFTVFAPTDAAFAALPSGTVEDLLRPENRGRLAAILSYHIVPGRITPNDFTEGAVATTVNGADLLFTVDGGPKVNGALISEPVEEATNGFVYAIDAVLLPPEG